MTQVVEKHVQTYFQVSNAHNQEALGPVRMLAAQWQGSKCSGADLAVLTMAIGSRRYIFSAATLPVVGYLGDC